MRKQPIYLDNHATTPLDPRVLEAMMPYLTTEFGNASSRSHAYGWTADAAVEKARAQVAELIGASPKEIVFTSGATESDNLAIKGVAEAYRAKGDHIVTLPTEHKAVLDACKRLERTRAEHLAELRRLRAFELCEGADLESDEVLRRWSDSSRAGARVTYVPVRPDGLVDLDALERAIGGSTILVSIMLANNEIGVVQPVNDIGRICRAKGVLFHTDAVQGAGKVPFDVNEANVDLASLSSHKIYGPKGVGALYVRRKPRVSLASMIDGGGQERGMRAGTLPVAAIVGFGKAAELCRTELAAESERLFRLRERLRESLRARLDGVSLNGSLEHRVPGNLNVSFAHVDAEALMMAMRDVALSSGSACASASLEGSHVLKACGVADEQAHGSIRFGIGRFNTEEEIDFVADSVVENVRRLRAMSPRYEMKKEGLDPDGRGPSHEVSA